MKPLKILLGRGRRAFKYFMKKLRGMLIKKKKKEKEGGENYMQSRKRQLLEMSWARN